MSLLAACESTPPSSRAPLAENGAAQGESVRVAGGETSEFSGGDIPAGFCPTVTSRTSLDLSRPDIAPLVALAQGQHEIPLHWHREFPDDRIRGFQERTKLLLDVTVLGAEDVVCESAPDDTSYETSGYRGALRRLELAVEFSTADGAVRGSFQRPFVADRSASGARYLYGGERFPIAEIEGMLELGVEPGLQTDSQTLDLSIQFADSAVSGALTPWVILSGPYLPGGGRPGWVPVTGTFPAPGEGCAAGVALALDEPSDLLGNTPRAAYELARERFPAQPLPAAWQDPWHEPGSLSWTEVSLSPGIPTHACQSGQDINVYASLRLDSGDGRVHMEPAVVVTVHPQPGLAGQPATAHDFSMSGAGHWTPRAEFEATAGIRDLELRGAEYGALSLYQGFNSGDDKLQGSLSVRKWQDHIDSAVEGPVLNWCAGSGCDLYWCMLTRTDDRSSCSAYTGAPAQ